MTACLWAAGSAIAASPGPATRPAIARHVLLIGLDGARADAIRDHAGPTLKTLIQSGTSCWNAQAVLPSVTQVNWASILTGCRPSTHGIDRHPVTEPELAAMRLKVPTLLDLVADQGGVAVGFLGHWKLYPNQARRPGAVTFHSPYESTAVAADAARTIVKDRPAVCFIYMGDLDGLGHRHGWMSAEYLGGLAKIDAAIATLLRALDETGIRDQTVVVITSDHGGREKSHAGGGPDDVTVPWIASGPGIARGQTIDRPISVIDTTPTILALLGMPAPAACDGTVFNEILSSQTGFLPEEKGTP